MGPRFLELVREVGRRITLETGEPRSTDFLLQRLSVAVQRGNCAISTRGHLTYVLILNIKCIIMSCAIIMKKKNSRLLDYISSTGNEQD